MLMLCSNKETGQALLDRLRPAPYFLRGCSSKASVGRDCGSGRIRHTPGPGAGPGGRVIRRANRSGRTEMNRDHDDGTDQDGVAGGKVARRRWLFSAGAACAGLAAVPTWAIGQTQSDQGVDVTPPEDLMREHGVLRRVLLIYEEGIRRIEGKRE